MLVTDSYPYPILTKALIHVRYTIFAIYAFLKDFSIPINPFDDRTPGCKEKVRFSLLKYMWGFEERVAEDIEILKEHYPNGIFKEIRCNDDPNKLKDELIGKL